MSAGHVTHSCRHSLAHNLRPPGHGDLLQIGVQCTLHQAHAIPSSEWPYLRDSNFPHGKARVFTPRPQSYRPRQPGSRTFGNAVQFVVSGTTDAPSTQPADPLFACASPPMRCCIHRKQLNSPVGFGGRNLMRSPSKIARIALSGPIGEVLSSTDRNSPRQPAGRPCAMCRRTL
ncbi:hypothetical protein LZ30DRAFT_145315 [Colletotrichum cereale]|nr:hypothetical protein LZ30DRAFT_145315 [Colletotrichum cereale]